MFRLHLIQRSPSILKLLVDWASFTRKCMAFSIMKFFRLLGRPDRVVEIDEAKWFRNKFHRGRLRIGGGGFLDLWRCLTQGELETVSYFMTDWGLLLPFVKYVVNSFPKMGDYISPFEVVFGEKVVSHFC